MRFDDRLKTVMTQPVADAHDRTVRWRQLVDLLSRPHEEIDPALLDAALTMVRSGLRAVARPIRAATARSIAGRASEPQLVAIFAGDKLEVAAPLLSSAQLDEAGWALVTKAASAEVANFIRSVRGGTEPSPPPAAPPAAVEPTPEDDHSPSISELVARIERLKQKRGTAEPMAEFAAPAPAPREMPAANPMLFRWECDASGQIAWVEGAPRGALIGRSLPGDEGADRRLIRAFADRLPFDGAPLTLPTPALEGDWRLSGIPAFSPVDGRFLGYRGVARRGANEAEEELLPAVRPALASDAETLRETIHEIKTPLNAIIGFAEIIDGQYLGPAHRSYRHRAAEIVSQARILLAAIEDLDFAARVQTGSAGPQVSTDLGHILPPLIEELAERALARGVELRVTPISDQHPCALDRDLAERLLRRLLGATVDAAAAAETIKVDVHEEKGRCLVSVTRPASTAHLSERQMLDPSFLSTGEEDGARLGLGFALRLVRGLVRLAGGSLKFTADHIVLTMRAAAKN
ncbi:MAG TPA: histidine kinase dimerization/phospho-acceptor domain-containing protein [Sphingomicrobium sp.]|nr:histidine kinase dimerization/phospho-acceptor domain-containing protein [Sphingomicrobium sp.]